MKPNKALQDTQAPRTSPSTSKGEISSQNANRDVQKVDNPISLSARVNEIGKYEIKRKAFLSSYRMNDPAYTILFIIYHSWVTEGKGMTATKVSQAIKPYKLSYKDVLTSVHIMMIKLYGKGLLEVVGSGRHNAKVYAPSMASVTVLQELLLIGYAA